MLSLIYLCTKPEGQKNGLSVVTFQLPTTVDGFITITDMIIYNTIYLGETKSPNGSIYIYILLSLSLSAFQVQKKKKKKRESKKKSLP